MIDGPIFRSVGQALHVSFLMAILPPTQRVSTQVLIDALREQTGKTEARIASTINIGGMSPLEFRGQCAMVRAAARDHLPAPEHDAIRCRFGHQVTKAEGVRGLADYLQAMADLPHGLALMAVCWSVYHRGSQRSGDRWSLGKIATETGASIHALRKAQDVVRANGQALESRGQDRLQDLFERSGLVDSLATV